MHGCNVRACNYVERVQVGANIQSTRMHFVTVQSLQIWSEPSQRVCMHTLEGARPRADAGRVIHWWGGF